jgi:hypothetical protein
MDQPIIRSTPAETREDLLRVSGRGYTKIRHLLVQTPSGTQSRPGKLGAMVRDRKRRSLQLYLLLLTAWPWLERQEKPLSAAVWARALSTDHGRTWTAATVSETWSDLERRGLVKRTRLSRAVAVSPMREDGVVPYTDPGGTTKNRLETYFTLPPAFWVDCWFEELSMPGLAMLLAVASKTSRKEDPDTWLTNEKAAEWFGLSTRSVESGLSELEGRGLITHRTEWVKAGLSPIGATQRHYYALNDDFSTESRLAMQQRAQEERRRRLKGRAQMAPEKKGRGKKKSSTGKAKSAAPAEGQPTSMNSDAQ